MHLVCCTESRRLAVVWWVYNTTAATQEINNRIHDGTWYSDIKLAIRSLRKKTLKTIWGSTIMTEDMVRFSSRLYVTDYLIIN